MKADSIPFQPKFLNLAKQYETPVFVYDTSVIKRQYHRLVSAFDGVPLKVHYACKALNNLEILRFIRHLGAGLDLSLIHI